MMSWAECIPNIKVVIRIEIQMRAENDTQIGWKWGIQFRCKFGFRRIQKTKWNKAKIEIDKRIETMATKSETEVGNVQIQRYALASLYNLK